MKKLTAADLVNEIAQLDTSKVYEYVSGNSRLSIINITKPEGPITFVNIGKTGFPGESRNITQGMLAKVAAICSARPDYPLHIDRILSAGGNTRSALEALLVHTPNFFTCYPPRVEAFSGEPLKNQKHFMWCPGDSHPIGVMGTKEYHEIITEIELGTNFGYIDITEASLGDEFDSIEAKRTHTQMQIALIEIGNALNFRTWIAKNDRSISVGNKTLGELEGVIPSLENVPIFYEQEIKSAASLIDCIWFTDDWRRIPAVIEIEHSTGVTSGLTRMRKLHDLSPSITKKFVVVAPNELRNKVIAEGKHSIFKDLDIHYMPYTTVRELYGLIQRYSLKNAVDYRFINPFMERVVEA